MMLQTLQLDSAEKTVASLADKDANKADKVCRPSLRIVLSVCVISMHSAECVCECTVLSGEVMQHCEAASVVDERVWSGSDHGVDAVSL